MLKDAVDLTSIRRALVVKLRHHGDVLLTSPVFTVLKNHAPHIEIDALVYRATEEMLTLHPAIANVFAVDREWKKHGPLHQFTQELRLIQMLRARDYDLLIHLTEHARGAWFSHLLGPRYGVAHDFPRKRGRLWRHSFSHLYKLPTTPRHTVEQHLDALRRIGVYPGAEERRLVLVPGPTAEQSVQAFAAQHGLAERGYIHVHPTSRWLFKCWPEDNMVALIDALQRAGERVVVTAAPERAELEMIQRIVARLERPVLDLSGQLSLKQLAALTARAKCFVGVDSVPMHIAAAMQTPVVALFGPSNEQLWGPWQVRQRVLTVPYSCRPCGLDGCGGGKRSECLEAVPVNEVLDAIRQVTQPV